MIWHIAKKDWKLLWPMVLLVAAIQCALEWALYKTGLFGEDPGAAALIRPLTLAWYIGIAAVAAATVHQDPIPGVDQDWLIRPLHRTHLLLAKLLFVATAVCVPMLAVNLADALAMGFPLSSSLEAAVYKEFYVFVCLVVPVMALAALTRNMTELVILGAALMVTFSVCVSLSAFLQGARWCPTCNSGVSWIQHAIQHVGVLIGSAALLGVQYYRRRTSLARALCLAGSVLFVIAQLPWGAAFGLQQRMTPSSARAESIQIELPTVPEKPAAADATETARRTLEAAPRNVDQAVQYLRRRVKREDAPVALDVPVRVSGATEDELLLADRTEIRLLDAHGRSLYRTDTAGALAALLTAYPGTSPETGAITHQSLDVPGGALKKSRSADRARFIYSLTLMKRQATHRLAALNGELDAPEVGRCAVINDRKSLYLRCKSIEQPPFCVSAVLVGPGGRSNPEVLRCTPDYRRHVPSFRDVLGFYGVDLPLQDRNGSPYPIDSAALAAAYVVFKVYAEDAHFERSVEVPASALPSWRAP